MRHRPISDAAAFLGRIAIACTAAILLLPSPAAAQNALPAVSMCQAIARALPGAHYIQVSAEQPAAGNDHEITIRYIGHSTFRITSPQGVTVATDYAGNAGRGPMPDAVTMNHAHSSHYTDFPDPEIPTVLRGWNPDGGKAEHNLVIGDVLIRNVSTDIRRFGLSEPFGNSIFIFETAGLCIGHLGHLHHVPSEEHYAQIGRLDIVFVPIDGGYTMAQPLMVEIVKRLRSSIIVPMHFFTIYNLSRFVEAMRSEFAIDLRSDPVLTVSLDTLPRTPTVVVLPGY